MADFETLKNAIRDFPVSPGVYIMKDFDGTAIYIGKAKSLRSRVRSYFGASDGRFQIQYLLRKVQKVDFIVTASEEEAFLLERDLIQKHKPRYNIRLKDDKSYLSIRINRDVPYPRLETVRQIVLDGADYYGPYPNSGALREVLEVIKRVVPLRSCTDSVFNNRVRPCLEYEIKRCSGPCCIDVDKLQYREWLSQATMILEGKIDPTIEELSRQMEEASEALRFEEAAAMRDRIAILENFRERGRESVSFDFTCDVFSLYREEDFAVVSVLKTRDGKMGQVESYDFREVVMTDDELLSAVIEQYYAHGQEIPKEIIVSCELADKEFIERLFETEFNAKTIVTVATIGPKHRLVKIGELNAKQSFAAKFFSEARYEALSKQIMERFHLRQAPRQIECFDISNFQGSDIVGAHVVFQDGMPYRKGYRRFKISFQDKPNDFEAMYEVVKRRLSREDKIPDLIIIDGGRQQLQKACQARDELEVPVEIVSIAKMRVENNTAHDTVTHKPERIFTERFEHPISLDISDEITHLFQRIRDEVHNYVVTYHRLKRKARVFRSVLDEISGIGPERKRRLLSHFGSVESIAQAPLEEIAKIGRMPASLAQKVLSALTS